MIADFQENNEAKLKELEEALKNTNFIGGDSPSEEDKLMRAKFTKEPDQKLINVWTWYKLISFFTPAIQEKWTTCKKEKKEKKDKKDKKDKKEKKEDKKEKEPEKKEDDMDDLFSGPSKEDEENLKKKAEDEEAKKKKKAKEKPIDRSMVIFEVSPYDDQTKLDEVAKKIKEGITMDGLTWTKEIKLEPIAFGINMLIIACIVIDDKVSVDEVQDKIEQFKDDIQSVNIRSFNKL